MGNILDAFEQATGIDLERAHVDLDALLRAAAWAPHSYAIGHCFAAPADSGSLCIRPEDGAECAWLTPHALKVRRTADGIEVDVGIGAIKCTLYPRALYEVRKRGDA